MTGLDIFLKKIHKVGCPEDFDLKGKIEGQCTDRPCSDCWREALEKEYEEANL